MRALLLLTVFACLGANAALASSSVWHKTEGARLRLVTTGTPDAGGNLSGALEIELKPGWKTYWRDPGSSGVPPSIDVSQSPNVASVDISYPAPARFDDASGAWVGYKHSVTLPLTFQLASSPIGTIAADVFIGVCEEICVPLQASLSVDVGSDPGNAGDKAVVDAGVASLPALAGKANGAKVAAATEAELVVTAEAGGKPDAVELFLAGGDGYVFGAPTKDVSGKTIAFTFPVLDRPANRPEGKGLPYTLVTTSGAVDGVLPFP